MMWKRWLWSDGLLTVLVCCLGASASGYSYRADFEVTDDVGEAYGIDIERRSHYSHAHARVEDGRYAILLSGNRHYLATPMISDFTLALVWSIETTHAGGPGYGLSIRFACDRNGDDGRLLELFRDRKSRRLSIRLDGRELVSRADDSTDFMQDQSLTLGLNGGRGHVAVCGLEANFEAGGKRSAGYVSVDAAEGSEQQLYLKSIALDSPESPVCREILRRKIELSATQGFALPVVYDVVLSRHASGETLVEAVLSGTVRSRPRTGRIMTGGSEWCSVIEKMDTPYVRLTGTDGRDVGKLNFWNGEKMLYDDVLQDDLRASGRAFVRQAPWPIRMSVLLFRCPDRIRIAAGYRHAIANPWRFAEEGEREKLLDVDGAEICDGTPLAGRGVCRSIASPADKRIVSKIPPDIPERERAVRMASRQHFFSASEKIRFGLSAVFRAVDWSADELRPTVVCTDVYGDPVGCDCCLSEGEEKEVAEGVVRKDWSVVLPRRLDVGVYKLVVDGRTEVFEVLPDEPDGPCPPLASKLPVFVSMPNEIKYLEQSAFDPWGELGGVSHYFSIDNRYPRVGEELEVWRLLPIYRRWWWCWNWSRNSDAIDPKSDYSRKLMKCADAYGGADPAGARDGRYDLGVADAYRGHQLEWLKAFLAEKGLTDRIPVSKPFTHKAFRVLFETCWREWVDWVRPRIEAEGQAFVDDLLSVNPKAAQGTYGPYAFYVSHYKTAYQLTYGGYPILDDSRLRKNGSFWIFEEYHHSCDYPLFRPAFFVATYDLHFGDRSRRIFPEIYYSDWERCQDGAVYMAHPMSKTFLADVHQRRIAYQYAYGTPQFRKGGYRFWRDYGFHARTPERGAMEEFIHAWRNVVRHVPQEALKATFVVHDLAALKRNGEYLDDTCNARIRRSADEWKVLSDVGNSAEDDLAYAFEQAVVNGYTTPVVTTYAELEGLSTTNAEFVILPPVVKETPEDVRRAIRALHARGVGLMAFEQVDGLEDLFGVRRAEDRTVGALAGEAFSNHLAIARYEAVDARTILSGAVRVGAPADIPIVLAHEKDRSCAVLVNVPPAMVLRASFRSVFHWGQDSLSDELKRGVATAFSVLAPEPAVKSDYGLVSAARTAAGDVVVVVSDEPPIYKDRAHYPVPLRLTLRDPGIGTREIEADADYEVAFRERDCVTIRTALMRDNASFFRFKR